jgi:carbon starvation protein CstA
VSKDDSALPMNKIDREILAILKEVFQLKWIRAMESDHNMRLWIIRSTFLVSVLALITRVLTSFMGQEVTTEHSAMINLPITLFFTVLFIHINNEVEETSLIIFVLTWFALMIGLWV